MCSLDFKIIRKHTDLNSEDTKYYLDSKMELVKERISIADSLGICNSIDLDYDRAKAVRTWEASSRIGIVVKSAGENVGIVEYELIGVPVEIGQETIQIHSIYLDEKHRRNDIYTEVINKIKSKYSKYALRIDCWYDDQFGMALKNIGFRTIKRECILSQNEKEA